MATTQSKTTPPNQRAQIFISYAHKDNDLDFSEKRWLDKVTDSLAVLDHYGGFKAWSDTEIDAGKKWRKEIEASLAHARVAILLLSNNFLGSEFIKREELFVLLKRAELEGSVTILALHIRANNWEMATFKFPHPEHGPDVLSLSEIQSLNPPKKPLNKLQEHEVDEILVEMNRQIVKILQESGPVVPPPTSRHNLPWERNIYFTGRKDELEAMEEQLKEHGRAAIFGLGGVGKTQTALEYAYCHLGDYNHIFWVRAENETDILDGYGKIAKMLDLPVAKEPNIELRAKIVKAHLEDAGAITNYLVIYDNGDDVAPVENWRPQNAGHILITSRARNFDQVNIIHPVEIVNLPSEDAQAFLLKRSGLDSQKLSSEDQTILKSLVEALGELPLAIEQAGAYIKQKSVDLKSYAAAYEKRRLEVLERGGEYLKHHPESVAATWLLNFEEIEKSPASAELLNFCAFAAPDSIPFELFEAGPEKIGPAYDALYKEEGELATSEALSEIARFSLLRIEPQERSCAIHRLVQEVIRSRMSDEEQREWAGRFVEALDGAFPDVKFENWEVCERLIEQAPALYEWVVEYDLASEEAARVFNRAGYYLQDHGRYRDVEAYFQKALELFKEIDGEENENVAGCLNNLAGVYELGSRYDDAEILYQESLAIYKKVVGVKAIGTAKVLNNLAGLYCAQGSYYKAEPLYEEALVIYKMVQGVEHLDTATALNNFASLYLSLGRYGAAEPLYKKTLEIRKKISGDDHLSIVLSLSGLGVLYLRWGRDEEAAPFLTDALALSKKKLNDEHPYMAMCLNNLASLYMNQELFDKADLLYQESLIIRKKAFGDEHPYIAESLNNLAFLYELQGRYDVAEPLHQESLAIRKKVLGDEHPDTANSLNNLGVLYMLQEKYKEALPPLEQAVAICEKSLGLDHPRTIDGEKNLEICRSHL